MDSSTSSSFVRLSTLLPIARSAHCTTFEDQGKDDGEIPHPPFYLFSFSPRPSALLPLERSASCTAPDQNAKNNLCGVGGALAFSLTHGLHRKVHDMQSALIKHKPIRAGQRRTVSPGIGIFGRSIQGFVTFGVFEHLNQFNHYRDEEWAYGNRFACYTIAACFGYSGATLIVAGNSAVVDAALGRSPYVESLKYRLLRELKPIRNTTVQFTLYEFATEAMYGIIPKADCSKPEQLAKTFAAGYIAGLSCATITYPYDALTTRTGIKDGATTMARQIGDRGFWTGFASRNFMMGMACALPWLIYDGFKMAMDLPRPTPSIPMPESLRKKLEERNIDLSTPLFTTN